MTELVDLKETMERLDEEGHTIIHKAMTNYNFKIVLFYME
jgi:hypothetical protein